MKKKKKQNQQPLMVIFLQFLKFTSVVYSRPTFCIAYMFSVHNKLNPSLSKALLTEGLPDNSSISPLVELHRDGTETWSPSSMLALPQGSQARFQWKGQEPFIGEVKLL